jgi:transposase
VINAIRAHLAEFGIVAPVGRNGVETLLHIVAEPATTAYPRSHGCALPRSALSYGR